MDLWSLLDELPLGFLIQNMALSPEQDHSTVLIVLAEVSVLSASQPISTVAWMPGVGTAEGLGCTAAGVPEGGRQLVVLLLSFVTHREVPIHHILHFGRGPSILTYQSYRPKASLLDNCIVGAGGETLIQRVFAEYLQRAGHCEESSERYRQDGSTPESHLTDLLAWLQPQAYREDGSTSRFCSPGWPIYAFIYLFSKCS